MSRLGRLRRITRTLRFRVTAGYALFFCVLLIGVGAIYRQKLANSLDTQIRNGQGQNGYVFVNCWLTSAPEVTGVYLARIDPAAFPYSQVVYINSAMDKHILPAGWQLNNSNSAPNSP